VLSLFGWLLMFIFAFGSFFPSQLLSLEKMVKSNAFIWGIRIFVFALVIFLFRGKEFVDRMMQNKAIQISIYTIFIGGAAGWLMWLISLSYFD
jgi:hypothetical protein